MTPGSRSIRISLSVTRGSRSSIPSSATSRSFPPTASSSSRTTARSTTISSCARSWRAPATRFARRPTPKCSSPAIGTGAGKSCRSSTASSRSRSTTGAAARFSARATRTARSRSSITVDGGRLAFSSECRTFALLPGFRSEIDPASLVDFLALESLPFDRSIYRDVRKLPPGHWLSFADGKLEVAPYFESVPRATSGHASGAALDAEIHELLRQSVKRTFRADVPVGLLLSRRPRLVDGARDPARGASDGAAADLHDPQRRPLVR